MSPCPRKTGHCPPGQRQGRWRLPFALLTALLALTPTVPAVRAEMPQGRQQDEARRAREEGRILDYGTILARARAVVPGRVVDQNLQRRGNGYVYRLKILRPNGRVARVIIDAHSGRVLAVKQRH